MFSRLLIPLDGSHLAETVLPAAAWLHAKLGSTLVLLHIIEPNAPKEVHGERHLRSTEDAREYLEQVCARWFSGIPAVERHVHDDQDTAVAQTILRHVAECNVDLIVMCTHGRHWARQLVFGSIAQQVTSGQLVPVWLFPPGSVKVPGDFALRKLMLPLDGDPRHEQGITVAEHLALIARASVLLFRAVPGRQSLSGARGYGARFLPATTLGLLDISAQEARRDLNRRKAKLERNGVRVVTDVRRGNPPDLIARIAGSWGADLIVLGTHGKAGGEAFWSGSVATRVCRMAKTPLLLAPALNEAHPGE